MVKVGKGGSGMVVGGRWQGGESPNPNPKAGRQGRWWGGGTGGGGGKGHKEGVGAGVAEIQGGGRCGKITEPTQ